ncbi:hypothetical protein PTSG_07021 [Salpingoeca rosetta]|uniref:ShKT domain-containing protein n=1 Tax=Salpingoeca rosetta (strain ATCC 50818 / BSB-021) TaxID=946362 RepID=F2UDT8_SALR5|nr:uncharacterized protein PTSG_07021 [Salpingoeca rosetta]EGD74788.1 hypothetical protein PTSG_07021 [Salpingoeca rosetta]|eukprot:XP_004992433.1 hypothetical protein PTSG_07021 [Salpingoeca rosetta]
MAKLMGGGVGAATVVWCCLLVGALVLGLRGVVVQAERISPEDVVYLDVESGRVSEYTVWGQVLGGFEHVKGLEKGEPPEKPSKVVQMRIPGDEDMDCVDHHDLCVWWSMPGELGFSKEGECKRNEEYMRKTCPLSCGYCPVLEERQPPCIDLYKDCEKWESSDECNLNPHWMANNCRKACGKC